MFDPEISKLYEELARLNGDNLQDGAENTTKLSQIHNASKIDPEFILNIDEHLPNNKDITLGEYLQYYNKIEQSIEQENKERNHLSGNNELEALISFLEEDEGQNQSERPAQEKEAMDNNINNIFLDSKDDKLNLNIEKSHEESNHYTTKKKFLSDNGNPVDKNIFNHAKNTVRQSPSQRKEPYSNTTAKLTDDSRVAPLNLKQYTSDKTR